MAMCLKLALVLFPQEKDKIVEKAENYKPPGMNRGEVRSFKEALVYLDQSLLRVKTLQHDDGAHTGAASRGCSTGPRHRCLQSRPDGRRRRE